MQKQESHNFPKFIMIMTIILLIGTLFGVVCYLISSHKTIENKSEIKRVNTEQLSDEVDTSNWETYKNEEYGFELKYPDIMMIVQKNNTSMENPRSSSVRQDIKDLYSVSLNSLASGVGSFEITIHKNAKKYSLEEWLMFNRENVEVDLIFEKDFIINGVKGLRGGFGCCMSYREAFFVAKGDYVYEILGGYMDFNVKPLGSYYRDELLFAKILSTFKFIEKNETADWKTYRNEEYGFEVKYPSRAIQSSKSTSEELFVTTTEKCASLDPYLQGEEFKGCQKIAVLAHTIKASFGLNAEAIKFGGLLGEKFYFRIPQNYTIDDVSIYRPIGQINAQVGKGSYWYKINIEYHLSEEATAEKLFNQILSTFKFIEKNEELTYKYDWADENCSSFFTKGFGLSASNKKDCEKWIDFNNESVYYKFGKNENLGDYFCEKNKSIHSGYYFNSLSIGPTSFNCSIVKSNTGHENVMRNGYHCNRAPCNPVICGDMPEIESCEFRDVLIAYTSNIGYPIVAIGHNWGNNCFSNEDIKEINRLDFKSEYDELDILMQKKYEECKIKNESSINEFNNYINNFELYKK